MSFELKINILEEKIEWAKLESLNYLLMEHYQSFLIQRTLHSGEKKNMDQSENFHQQLRDIIPKISEARVEVLKSEVNLKTI